MDECIDKENAIKLITENADITANVFKDLAFRDGFRTGIKFAISILATINPKEAIKNA